MGEDRAHACRGESQDGAVAGIHGVKESLAVKGQPDRIGVGTEICESGAITVWGKLLNETDVRRILDVFRYVEISLGVEGEPFRVAQASGENRNDSSGRDFHDGAGNSSGIDAVVRHIKIPRSIESQGIWLGQAAVSKVRSDTLWSEFHDRVIAGVCRVEITQPVKRQARWKREKEKICELCSDASRRQLLDRPVSLRCEKVPRTIEGHARWPIGSGKERADTVRRELLNRPAGVIRHINNARADIAGGDDRRKRCSDDREED